MKAPIVLTLMLAAMLAWLIGYSVAPLGFDSAYFICDAIAKLCVTLSLYTLLNNHDFTVKLTATVLMASAFSNLIDELFFDPTAISVNEYVFVLLIALYTIYHYATKRVRHNP